VKDALGFLMTREIAHQKFRMAELVAAVSLLLIGNDQTSAQNQSDVSPWIGEIPPARRSSGR
jgi:hypothetical protein